MISFIHQHDESMRLLCIFVIAISLISIVEAQNAPATAQPAVSPLPPRFDPKIMRAPVPSFVPTAMMPDDARRSGIQGMCLVAVIVDVAGNPGSMGTVGCTNPIFAPNSLEAARKYRFKPAQLLDGKPIAVMIGLEIGFSMGAGPPMNRLQIQIRYGFFSPPAMTSLNSDPSGVYPLSKQFEPPQLVDFIDKGFGHAALAPQGIGCHAVLTIAENGKSSDVQVGDCDRADLEKPALDSLLQSKYKPATLHGKPVSVRASIHLIYDGFGPSKKLTQIN